MAHHLHQTGMTSASRISSLLLSLRDSLTGLGRRRAAGEEWRHFLKPRNAVHPGRESPYRWRSEGDDPQFELKGVCHTLRPGWYMLELCIRLDEGEGKAKLFFDHGDGFSESTAVALPFRDGVITKRLYCLDSVPQSIRFDPIERVADFSIEHLRFVPVQRFFARNHMLRWLCIRNALYRGRSIGLVWQDLRAQAKAKNVTADELLYSHYNAIFRISGLYDLVSYPDWIAKFESPELSDLAALELRRKSFRHQPTVSVVMPTYNSDEKFLRQAIESVLAQSYSRWELCVADDASSEPHVRAVLEEYARTESRIKVIFRPENGHISAASNSALSLASGEYVALLGHGDKLAAHALHFVAEAINDNPDAQILYSDEDKIDETGERTDPHFKPDWNPDLFLSLNYVSRFGVYRRELIQRIGGFREGVEGIQDYDLLLRCLLHVKSAEITHIPRVLYHCRTLVGSSGLGAGPKQDTTAAGIRVLRDFFNAYSHHNVTVENGLLPDTYRVRYPVPDPEPLVSLLVPTRDKLEFLEPCIRSILDKTTYSNYELLVLDNDSAEAATLDFFARIQAEDARVKVLPYHHAFNFPAINNYGVRQAQGELVGLVNNDIEVITPEWLTEMVSHAVRPEIGCVGAKLNYDDDTIQHAGVVLGIGGVAGHSHKHFLRHADGYFSRLKVVQNLSAVTAACLVVRKALYVQVGGLEENGLSIAFNDVDFCLKLREAGYRNLWTPYAELYHHESKSRGTEDAPDKVERFNSECEFIKAKWGEVLRRDPCYNQNLTLEREDFSLRT
jgi:glycosyltransferase involved in cell wall biosynthesis